MTTWLVYILLAVVIIAQGYIAWKIRDWFRYFDRRFSEVYQRFSWHEKEMESHVLEIQHSSALNALNFKWPLFLGGWSIDSFMGRFLVQHIIEKRPRTIVELGSGSSTIVISHCLQLLCDDAAVHVAIDHESKYLHRTQEHARLNGLEDRIIFLECPLERYEGFANLWYGGVAEKLKGKRIDLLIVDGPPGPLQSFSRYPAVPLLHELLAPHCTVILDDAARSDEKEIVQRWANEFTDFEMSLYPEGHGISVLSR